MRKVEINPTKFLNQREVYLQAQRELATPYPAIELPEWSRFNRFTGGFRAREFSILCGPTGAGKTTLLANLSAQLLKADVKHFVMSVETGYTDFMKRVMSVLAGKDLNTGEAIDPEELVRLHVEQAKYFERDTIEFALYDNRVPVEQLCYDLTYMCNERGCKIAMIDNLNFFMEVSRSQDTLIEMDRVVHELVILCKRIDMHVIMVMHPRKTENGRIESENDIRGSALANQEAHNIFLYNRPHPELIARGKRERTQRELTLKKMRRRGIFVESTLIFDNQGTCYVEKGFVDRV